MQFLNNIWQLTRKTNKQQMYLWNHPTPPFNLHLCLIQGAQLQLPKHCKIASCCYSGGGGAPLFGFNEAACNEIMCSAVGLLGSFSQRYYTTSTPKSSRRTYGQNSGTGKRAGKKKANSNSRRRRRGAFNEPSSELRVWGRGWEVGSWPTHVTF